MTSQRLRDRPLTEKPRVIVAYGKQFYVEKMTEHGPIVETQRGFNHAINLATWWAKVKKEASA